MPRPLRLAAALALLAVAAATVAGVRAADAAYPGGNGLIVFVSNRGGGGYALYTMKPDGSGVHRITPKAAMVRQPAWSPDGSQIAYVQNSRIWVVTASGAGAHAIGPTGGVGFPTWGPGGAKLVFEWNDSVFSMAADGTAVTPVRVDEGAGSFSKWAPSWSADGTRIVYVEGNGEHSGSIWAMSPTGAGAHALTTGGDLGNIDSAPDWSPNGKRVALERYIDCSGGSCTNAVWVMNANGSGLHQVLKDAAFPSWSPDGTKLSFVRKVGGSSEIFVASANGTAVKRLTKSYASDFSPDWQPS